MKKIISIIFLTLCQLSFGQSEKFSNKIDELIDFSVDTISITTLKENLSNYTVLDSREINEFKVSHIQNAKCIGFEHFNLESFQASNPDKTKPIAIYCSIGARSEQIGKKLIDAGYTNVKNVYGGIFEWANQSLPVVDIKQDTTANIHTYSKEWSIWLEKGNKVYEN